MKNAEKVFTEKHWRIYLAVIMAVAVALRAVGLPRNVFFIDEAFSYVLASHGLKEILHGAMSESNPPLPMLIFHVWQMFGKSEVFLRILPLIFNVLTIPVVFALGRRMRGTGAGLASAALFAAAAGMLDLSLIYRYPALLTLLGGLIVLLYFRSADTKPVFSLGSLAVLVLFEIAGLYTHYFFIFPVLGLNLIVLWDVAVAKSLSVKRFGVWLAGQAVAAAAFAPWLVAFRQQASKELAWIPLHQSLSHLAHSLFGAIPKTMIGYLIGPYVAPAIGLPGIIVVAGLLILIVMVFYLIDSKTRGLRFRLLGIFAAVLLVPYFMMIFWGLRLMPIYFCVASPIFFVVMGAGTDGTSWIMSLRIKKTNDINSLWSLTALKYFTFVFLIVMLISLSFYAYKSRVPRVDNKKAINVIAENWREGDIVVINPTYQASLFEYFAPGRFKLFGIPKDFDILKYNFNDTSQVTEKRLHELDGIVGNNGRIWAFMGFGTKTKPDQNELTIRYLRKNYVLVKQIQFTPISFSRPDGRLYLFERPDSNDRVIRPSGKAQIKLY